MNRLMTTVLASIVLSGALSGCSLDCTASRPRLDDAAAYPQRTHDAWTSNPQLESFLRSVLETEGAGALSAKYGMQCVRERVGAGCNDCFACSKTVKEWRLDSVATLPILKCVDWGEILVQASIGPGSVVKAMTYWKTSPEAREHIARPPAPPPIYVPPHPSAPSRRD